MRIDRVKLISFMTMQNVKQYELSNSAGVSLSTVNSICCGRSCREETAKKIASALGVELKEIVE